MPPSGNLGVAGKQFWLGPARAGVTVTFWADERVIHLLIAGARVKTVRSHLSSTDLAALAGNGARPAGPSPIPPTEPEGTALEVDRTISDAGLVSLGSVTVLAAEILGAAGSASAWTCSASTSRCSTTSTPRSGPATTPHTAS